MQPVTARTVLPIRLAEVVEDVLGDIAQATLLIEAVIQVDSEEPTREDEAHAVQIVVLHPHERVVQGGELSGVVLGTDLSSLGGDRGLSESALTRINQLEAQPVRRLGERLGYRVVVRHRFSISSKTI